MKFAAVIVVCSAILAQAPALANTHTFSDPAGDGRKGVHLDFTAIRVANRSHVIVPTVSFVKASYGDLGVAIKERGRGSAGRVVVTSNHQPGGDTNRLHAASGVEHCKGFSVTWDEALNRARIHVPSRCVVQGHFGAIKVQAITEIGSDADYAPKSPKGNWVWTDWVARG
jgi:hypothetical protein